MTAKQFSGKAGNIASQIIAVGQSDPTIMVEFPSKFHAERAAMSRGTVERLMHAVPAIRERIEEKRLMELFDSPIHTGLLLRHHPINREFIQTFPLDFLSVFGVVFDEKGQVHKLARVARDTANRKTVSRADS